MLLTPIFCLVMLLGLKLRQLNSSLTPHIAIRTEEMKMAKEKKSAKHDFYWTGNNYENLNKLKKLYPTASWDELLKVFSGRNRQAISHIAYAHGIKRAAQDGWNNLLDDTIKNSFEASQNPKLTTNNRGVLKLKLINEINRIAAKNNLRPKKWNTILKHAHELGLSWGASEEAPQNGDPPAKNLWDTDVILAYLIDKRNAKALERHFGEPISEIEKKLPQKIGSHELVSYRAAGGQHVYFYREKTQTRGEIQLRIHTTILPTDENGQVDDGSLLVKFPNDLDWRQIRIISLAEAYIGSPLHEEKRFADYLALAKQTYHYFIIGGGLFSLPPKGKVDDKYEYLLNLQDAVKARLLPIAHKILWAQQGCTERQIERIFNFDPLADVCKELGIPYFRRPVLAVVTWKTHTFSFYAIHGVTTAKQLGSMINAVAKLLNQFDKVDFVVMPHMRAGMKNVIPRRVRDRTHFRIVDKNQRLVIPPSFRKYAGSEEEYKGQSPSARGSCAMILFPDGDCGYSD